MIRNFSLSLAAVTLRLYLVPLLVFAHSLLHPRLHLRGLDVLVPDILVAKWIIHHRSAIAAILGA